MPAKLNYGPEDRFAPIPPWEKSLQTVTAELFVRVPDAKGSLEGLCFDRKGDLYCTEVNQGRILKVDMQTKEVTTVWRADPERGHKIAAVKIHKDGRLFVAICSQGGRALMKHSNVGGIMVMNPDGTDARFLIEGYNINDLCFDRDGGFVFGEYIGTFQEPKGGVYRVDPSFQKITPVLTGLASPNGVCLSKDGRTLWVAEMATGFIIRYLIEEQLGYVPYHTVGGQGPDSVSIDNDDNLYVAMYRQGRYLVFNREGHPIGQILLPNREKGHNLNSTHAMCRPGKEEVYLTGYDYTGDEGAAIYVAGSFAKGNEEAYQFQ
ncbi:MAG: SMP-30/gluconolactonase/LRE family protein [Lachnospiraceae bacterium]|nr:SMP-30/gluconolactonase/LRE family protein [Lachnospiraceae bacterium]